MERTRSWFNYHSFAFDSLDENAHKHAFGVSDSLKYAIREAIEALGNEAARQLRQQAADKKKSVFSGEYEIDEGQLSLECLRLVEASLSAWRPDRSFDLITCVHGLHYVGDKLGLVARAASWLAEDGLFVEAKEDNPYANFVVTTQAEVEAEGMQELKAALESQQTADWIKQTYGESIVAVHGAQ